MNKSILILEENSIVHGLVASSLDMEGISLHHEFEPDQYLAKARLVRPDLILISNEDQSRDYKICNAFIGDPALSSVPRILLANSRDKITEARLNQLQLSGVIRKPFEAGDLQQQVSKFLNLPDFLGVSSEYRKSGSMTEDTPHPLAGVKVLDPDVLGLLNDEPEEDVREDIPDVDFTHELEIEGAAGFLAGSTLAEDEALPDSLHGDMPLHGEDFDESQLHGQSTETQGFEESGDWVAPGGELPDESGGFESTLGMDEGYAGEFEEPQQVASEVWGEDSQGFGRDGMEEGFASGGLDQPLAESFDSGMDADREPGPGSRVDVELSEGALDYQSLGQEMEEGVSLFESDLGSENLMDEGPEKDEDVPPAIRRMVDMKPALSISEEERSRMFPEVADETEAEEGLEVDTSFSPSDDELRQMAQDIQASDHLIYGEEPQPAAEIDAGEYAAFDSEETLEEEMDVTFSPSDEELRRMASDMESQELFVTEDAPSGQEEMLGEAVQEGLTFDEEPAAFDEEPQPFEEVESSLNEEPFAFGGEHHPAAEIKIAEDGESFTFSSEETSFGLEEGDGMALEEDGGELGVDQGLRALEEQTLDGLDEMEESLSGMMDSPPAAGLAEPSSEELAIEVGAPGENVFGEGPTFEPDSQPSVWEPPHGEEEELEMVTEEPVSLEEPQFGRESLEGDMESYDFGTEESDPASWGDEEPPLSDFGGDESEPMESPSMDFGGNGPAVEHNFDLSEVEGVSDDNDFESLFDELKAEISANPIGERLEDVLANEGILGSVAALDFAPPEEDRIFTRAVGIYELPEGGEGLDSAEDDAGYDTGTLDSGFDFGGGGDDFASAPPSAPPQEEDSFDEPIHHYLDSLSKEKLNNVLEEVISNSVRKALEEEVPKMIRKIKKDEGRHGA